MKKIKVLTKVFGCVLLVVTVMSYFNWSRTYDALKKIRSCPVKPTNGSHSKIPFKLVGYWNTTVPKCSHAACQLNEGRRPVVVTPIQSENACQEVTSCVTVIIRTRHRLNLVMGQIKSVRLYYPTIKFVIVDDLYVTDKKLDKTWVNWLDNQNIDDVTYVQTLTGVGYGRNIALRLVKTPYFFLTDDDFVITKDTDFSQLLNVLENTDLSIAATDIDKYRFEGVLRVMERENDSKPLVEIHTRLAFETVPCFPRCYVMDTVKNCFMAKTKDILKAGGWDSWNNFFGHEDFLMRMRLAALKIAKCPGVSAKHLRDGALYKIRMKFYKPYRELLLRQWQLVDIHYCYEESYDVQYGCEKPRKW